jgi:rod shape-determining protein MreD
MRWHSRFIHWLWLGAAALVVKTSLLPYFFPTGYVPDLMLALVAILAFYEHWPRGMAMGLVLGLLQDLWAGRLIGLNAFTFALVGGGVAYLQTKLVHDRLFVPGLLAGLSAGFAGLLDGVLLHLSPLGLSWDVVLAPLPYRILTTMLLAPAFGQILGLKPEVRVDYRRSHL